MLNASETLKIKDAQKNALVRLAKTKSEIFQAQKLRYQVFYKEYGAQPSTEMAKQKRDFDDFDDITDHLVVVVKDETANKDVIVGTYRLLRQEIAQKAKKEFYSSGEYDISPLIKSNQKLLELGRSCVLAEYRTKPILNLLWEGIANYITDNNIDILFGCASFQGTDKDQIATQLSYLHHFHSTPPNISPTALEHLKVDMNIIPKSEINERKAFASLPPLIKGYLRLGATIGNGAVIDKQFNTIDVCIVVQTNLMTERYRKYYERKIQKTMPGQNRV